MGVTGLWQIVQPCARPIKIETLNRKRLAVDASIWIYQFLKAVRDKEGNALRNSHVVGFFRRICKLLFFGIKPVFVFDGGAPSLKRSTISARKARREGRREDAVRTAGKLLAVQMQRRAEEEEANRREVRRSAPQREESVPDEALVYVDEMGMSQQQRQQNRKFRKKDQYHLPDLDVSMSEMGGANDPRIMSLEELQSYARQFDTGEDINVYDFSKIDYDSPFFTSLPASDRYNILNAARLRSRLRMGHSKEQLDSMFPDRMAFSKFQIERVRERNELTQRLMHLNGFEGTEYGLGGPGRIAGEKGREYVLVKNDGVEGGWALGVISDEGKQSKPIDLDKPMPQIKEESGEDDEDGFEDVPIEGLNRLPKLRTRNDEVTDKLMKQRKNLYRARKRGVRRATRRKQQATEESTLFVQESDEDMEDAQSQSKDGASNAGDTDEAEDEDLRRAIAMSLQKDGNDNVAPASENGIESLGSGREDEDMLEVFHQTSAPEAKPLPKGSGRAIANIVNRRAFEAAPESREITSFGVPTLKPDDSDGEDAIDFQAALAESRRSKRRTSPSNHRAPPPKPVRTASEVAKKAGFAGPLPFEKLDLGSSLLGKKKMQERTEDAAGGFENPELGEKAQKKSEPLPPWFSGDIVKDLETQKAMELDDIAEAREFNRQFQFQEKGSTAKLRRGATADVIDLEAEDAMDVPTQSEPIVLDDDNEEIGEHEYSRAHNAGNLLDTALMDASTSGRAEPLVIVEDSPKLSDPGEATQDDRTVGGKSPFGGARHKAALFEEDNGSDAEDAVDWSESERGSPVPAPTKVASPIEVDGTAQAANAGRSRSPSEEFEDVGIPDLTPDTLTEQTEPALPEDEPILDVDQLPGLPVQDSLAQDDEFDDFSDPEEQELLQALTLEAEEHARFASSLNNKTQAQNGQEYEKELKQLRNQQKKDRRDADEVTHIMITECQQLLRLFGLPYITAPMEAEAQCAELVTLGLVDGIVTDDSDCFLFGGTRIYKNMFNQAKFVECYLTSDLEKEFSLTRDKLISIAHLLGSDYTEGLIGVGPVTALEIISEFPNLEAFRDWWTGVQLDTHPAAADASHPFRRKFRRSAAVKKLFLPPAFPDPRVHNAYTHPDVDRDPQPFQWGVPDLAALRSYLMATIGWSQERTDEVLVPVIRDMNRRVDEGTQANITAFFDGAVGVGSAGNATARGEAFAPRRREQGSKRMGSALNKLAEKAKRSRENGGAEEDDDDEFVVQKSPKKRTNARSKRTTDGAGDGSGDDVNHDVEDDSDESDYGGRQAKTRKRVKRPTKSAGA